MKLQNLRICVLLGMIVSSFSYGKYEEIRVELRATIQAPVCKMNNDLLLQVVFPEINPAKIDGMSFPVTTTVKLDCPSGIDKLYPVINVQGTPATFEGAKDNVLQVDGIDNLGIGLFKGHEPRANPLKLNEWVDLASSDVDGGFTFTSVLVKKEGADLDAGEFSASATMRMEYR